ncbi:hypothetical protein CMUS01_10123 [Colletotrichum musicola]|uniref:Uncharacterized protein n=1 Tax=Colletotrichum musicola TaxID=2175873 RepID=A0A8H6K5P8_9PEZI|nr:hypothetical protein CMUS01_10123 [Colletotrichum musicola]
MATGSSHDKPTEDDTDFDITSNVIAVLGDEGRPPQVAEQLFTLRAQYHPDSSVLFRLFPVTNSTSTRFMHCLQIKAGDIKSLGKGVYGTAKRQTPPPPWFGAVSSLLGGMKSVACLQFQLHSPSNVDLITHSDFNTENMAGDPAPDTWASLESLSTASLFSLCFRHDLITNKTLKKYQWAIREYPNLAAERKKAYECVVDVRRLFHGAGVKVPMPGVDCTPPPTREYCSSPTPSASTLPFDTVPRDSGASPHPPPYDACPIEGLSPAATPFGNSRGGDYGLWEYDDSEQQGDAVNSCNNQIGILFQSLFQQIKEQGQQIEELQKSNKELQEWRKGHERLLSEVEGSCFQLGQRQDDVDDVIGSLSQDVDDLAGKHDELSGQILDVSDEVRDCMEQIDCTVEESIHRVMQKEIEEAVKDEAAASTTRPLPRGRALVDALLKEQRETLSPLLSDAIGLRKQCLPYLRGGSRWGHERYIRFLQEIWQHLQTIHRKDQKKTSPDINIREPAVDPGQEQRGTGREQSGRAEPPVGAEPGTGHADGLTLGQIDILSFLEPRPRDIGHDSCANNHRPATGLGNVVSTIFLCEARRLINERRLLDEVDREQQKAEEGRSPWADADPRGCGTSDPTLAKDWVAALDRAAGTGVTWHKLAALPPAFISYMALLKPSFDAIPTLYYRQHMPYAFGMLFDGRNACENYTGNLKQMSLADLPLVTIIRLYLFSLVLAKDAWLQSAPIRDTRYTVCAELDECLAILPRLITDKSVINKEAEAFCNEVATMKLWASACREPISLGDIHVFARAHWIDWYGRLIASNSSLLQTFLYLCEKQRLEAPVYAGQSATGPSGDGGGDEDDDKRLLGALLDDQRVVPLLFKNGRPRTVQQCITALSSCCHVPTKDGETLSPSSVPTWRSPEETERNQKVIERSCQRRTTSLLMSQVIQNTRHEVLIDTRTRLRKWGNKADDDDDALARYLTWETASPNCLKLEQALRTTLQKLPVWTDMTDELKSQSSKITQLLKNHDVQVAECIMCLMPLGDSNDPDKGRRAQRKKKKKKDQALRQERSRRRRVFVDDVFKAFMNEARPVFEHAYGKSTSTSPSDIGVPMGRLTI